MFYHLYRGFLNLVGILAAIPFTDTPVNAKLKLPKSAKVKFPTCG